MFGLLAALVERGVVQEVEVNFLIVGHTHNRLDGWFSQIARQVRSIYVYSSPS